MFDSGLCSCVCSLKVSAEVVFDEYGWLGNNLSRWTDDGRVKQRC